MTSTNEVHLGGETPLLEPDAERKGVAFILESLTEDEKARMTDPAMPVRHLRAVKVRGSSVG